MTAVNIAGLAAEFGLSLEDLQGPSRRGVVVEARRQIARQLRREGKKLIVIAALLKRNQSVISHYLKADGWGADGHHQRNGQRT